MIGIGLAEGAVSDPWVQRMRGDSYYKGFGDPHILPALKQIPPELRDWVEHITIISGIKLKKFINSEESYGLHLRNCEDWTATCISVLNSLRDLPGSSHSWITDMIKAYIPEDCPAFPCLTTLHTLVKIPVESQQWVARMAQTYRDKENSRLLNQLRETPINSQEWVEEMAQFHIRENSDAAAYVYHLRQVPPRSQEWMKRMTQRYVKREYKEKDALGILEVLQKTPAESQEWVEHMVQTYINERCSAHNRHDILWSLSKASLEDRGWIEQMSQLYIKGSDSGDGRAMIIYSLARIESVSREWAAQILSFLIESDCDNTYYTTSRDGHKRYIGSIGCPAFVISKLEELLSDLQCQVDLLEPARAQIMAESNQFRERSPLKGEDIGDIFHRVSRALAQQVRINPTGDRPLGRALEVHFAASLLVPAEERTQPLYRAVETYINKLALSHPVPLERAVSTLQGWVDTYADEDKKALYRETVTKGYGDGTNPDYNQEITPLLRFVVPYMATLPETVLRAWLLPVLQESATAYDGMSPLSCAKGIQERLTMLGFNDLEGVDPTLRSLSQFSRTFVGITDRGTHEADTWVRDAVEFIGPEARLLILGPEKPTEEIFKDLFPPAFQALSKRAGLNPLYADALLKNQRIQMHLNISLEMYYQVDTHYQTLQEQARAFQTQEERREFLATAGTRRLAAAEIRSPEDI